MRDRAGGPGAIIIFYMINGKIIGTILMDAHKEIYGTQTPNGIFGGGNPGLIAQAIAINNHGQALKEGMLAIARAIETTGKNDESIIKAMHSIATTVSEAPVAFPKVKE